MIKKESMCFKLSAVLYNTETPQDFNSDLDLSIDVELSKRDNADYCTVLMRGPEGYGEIEILTFKCADSFSPNNVFTYLTKWVEDCWNGEDGGYKLKSINISRL